MVNVAAILAISGSLQRRFLVRSFNGEQEDAEQAPRDRTKAVLQRSSSENALFRATSVGTRSVSERIRSQLRDLRKVFSDEHNRADSQRGRHSVHQKPPHSESPD